MTPRPALPACAPAAERQPVGAARVPRSATSINGESAACPFAGYAGGSGPLTHRLITALLSTPCRRMYDTGVPVPNCARG
jgi:hypothetical protein